VLDHILRVNEIELVTMIREVLHCLVLHDVDALPVLPSDGGVRCAAIDADQPLIAPLLHPAQPLTFATTDVQHAGVVT
jgi:hypothetical protein